MYLYNLKKSLSIAAVFLTSVVTVSASNLDDDHHTQKWNQFLASFPNEVHAGEVKYSSNYNYVQHDPLINPGQERSGEAQIIDSQHPAIKISSAHHNFLVEIDPDTGEMGKIIPKDTKILYSFLPVKKFKEYNVETLGNFAKVMNNRISSSVKYVAIVRPDVQYFNHVHSSLYPEFTQSGKYGLQLSRKFHTTFNELIAAKNHCVGMVMSGEFYDVVTHKYSYILQEENKDSPNMSLIIAANSEYFYLQSNGRLHIKYNNEINEISDINVIYSFFPIKPYIEYLDMKSGNDGNNREGTWRSHLLEKFSHVAYVWNTF